MNRNLSMFFVGALLLNVNSIGNGQIAAKPSDFEVSITTKNIGMIVPEDERLYATISSKGKIVSLEIIGDQVTTTVRQLEPNERYSLWRVIASSEFRQMPGLIAADHVRRDYHTVLEIKVKRGQTTQMIVLNDFYPIEGRRFPPPVENLMCVVDALRKTAYKLSLACPPTQARLGGNQ